MTGTNGGSPGALAPGTPILATFLVNDPAYYQFLTNWLPYNVATPITTNPTPGGSPSADPLYVTVAVSGSGSTWGTSITGIIPSQCSVSASSYVTVAADVTNSQHLLETGFAIGLLGKNYPIPYFEEDTTIYALPATRIPSGTDVSFRVTDAQSAGDAEATVYDFTNEAYYLQGTFPAGDTATPRTNLSVASVSNSSTDTTGGNGGFAAYGYYEPDGSPYLYAWGSYSIYNESPYHVNRLNSQNYFSQPIHN
ncbi:MAG: hypothetical protein WA976_03685 [Candidatus Dormiibacterota bacterium]